MKQTLTQSVLMAVLMHASYTGWLLVRFPATALTQSLIWQSHLQPRIGLLQPWLPETLRVLLKAARLRKLIVPTNEAWSDACELLRLPNC